MMTAVSPDDGLLALCAVRPVLQRVERAREVVALPGRWLLHAGPPYDAQGRLPRPVLASAVMAARYEGWATSDEAAEVQIAEGDVKLFPAQSFGGVTPLAAMVSPSTAVAVVADAGRVGRRAFAPLGTTAGADLRFGTRDPSILDRLRHRDQVEAAVLDLVLSRPIDLLPLMDAAIRLGDDLHNRTFAATQLFVDALKARLNAVPDGGDVARFLRALESTPLYFLTIAMAAAKCMLMAAEGCAPASLVTAMGGNGQAFGLQLARRPGYWFVAASAAPEGPRFGHVAADAPVLNAIGDSAVIDALGLGGHMLAHAPEPRAALRDFLPAELADLPATLLAVEHPFFDHLAVRVGLDARRVVERDTAPLVTIAMIDAMGNEGLLGRGVYRPTLGLFRSALSSIDGPA